MQKGNVIDLTAYRNQQTDKGEKEKSPISEDLEQAIQRLILQLREYGPIKI